MITLKYLEELGKFTINLVQDLKVRTKLPGLWQRNVEDFIHTYHFREDKMLYLAFNDSGFKTYDMIKACKQSEKLSLVKYDFIHYRLGLEKFIDGEYSTEQFKDDWFSLSTALSDSEIIELYVSNYVKEILRSTCNYDRILFNASIIHEYYQSLQNKDS